MLYRKLLRVALFSLPVTAAAQSVITINVTGNRHAISPYIYGTAFPAKGQLADLNFTASRFGGNEASSYNWELNAQAKGNDWYFESWPSDSSSTAGEAVDNLIGDAKSAGAKAFVTVPMLNYVAKLGTNRSVLWSYSIKKYGSQTGYDPYNGDAGDGVSSSSGNPLIVNNVNDANTANSVSLQQSWLKHLLSKWGAESAGGVKFYLMDNEPSLWSSTHQDVHPVGPKMSEIYNAYVNYAGAVRAADPNAFICGPEEWGWEGYFYSGYDQQYAAEHGYSSYPDRSANGNMDYIPWLLKNLKAYQTKNGKQLLNALTVHYYPQQGEYSDDDSATMQAIRNRSTRSLWDPNYVDTSWIDAKVDLIPRLQQWVSTYYPDLQTGITEYNWGDESKLNGATAQADLLGIFGRQGLNLATRWTTPATGSPAYLAMKIFRNYDGAKSAFGDNSVEVTGPNPDNVAVYAAQRTSDSAVTVVVINKLTTGGKVNLKFSNFTTGSAISAWQISSATQTSIKHLANITPVSTGTIVSFPAQSITLYVVPPKSGTSKI